MGNYQAKSIEAKRKRKELEEIERKQKQEYWKVQKQLNTNMVLLELNTLWTEGSRTGTLTHVSDCKDIRSVQSTMKEKGIGVVFTCDLDAFADTYRVHYLMFDMADKPDLPKDYTLYNSYGLTCRSFTGLD